MTKVAPSAIDLFAGGGGLTVGLKRAGFRVTAAVELEYHAQKIYHANHPEIPVLNQDIRTVSGAALLKLSGRKNIDFLVGCPPCQGFTSLTYKYKRDDTRNSLVLEMARLARELQPRAIMMENVPSLRHKDLYRKLRRSLIKLGYIVSDGVLNVADYGVPQQRNRLVLLGGMGFKIELPRPTHSKNGKDVLSQWKTVRETIGRMKKPVTLDIAKKSGLLEKSNWHVVRTLSEKSILRLQSVRAGESWEKIPEELRPPCHQGGYKGFLNVYGRMEWDCPSPTITGGCTTLSKGRFGHPVQDRTISVREAALLQTFPQDYRFETPYMEHACNIIGNALPCDFAEVASKQCMSSLAS